METLKSRNYKVSLDGRTYHFRLELQESGAFQYGNQTCMVHYIDGEREGVYDTRYEAGIISKWEEWADDWIGAWCDPKCEIEVVR